MLHLVEQVALLAVDAEGSALTSGQRPHCVFRRI